MKQRHQIVPLLEWTSSLTITSDPSATTTSTLTVVPTDLDDGEGDCILLEQWWDCYRF